METESVSIIGLQHKYIGGSGYRVTNTQLQKMNQGDVNKVLRSMPGIQVRDEEGFGLRSQYRLAWHTRKSQR